MGRIIDDMPSEEDIADTADEYYRDPSEDDYDDDFDPDYEDCSSSR